MDILWPHDSPSLETLDLDISGFNSASYETEENEDKIILQYIVEDISEKEDAVIINHYITLCRHDMDESFVEINVSQDGCLIEKARFYTRTFEGHLFRDLNTEQGADFAPIFGRMLEVYKENYVSILVKDIKDQ